MLPAFAGSKKRMVTSATRPTPAPYVDIFPAEGVSNARRWTVVWLLFVASLINYFDRQTVSFALPLIAHEFSLTPVTKGVLLSAFFWSYSFMQVPIGWCADRLNLHWVYAGAFALWSFAQGLTGLAGSLVVLVALRIMLGIGESIYLPGGNKVVSLLFSRKERGLPCGLFDSGTRSALVIEGLLIPWLLLHLGWRRTFMIVGFTALVWLVPWLTALPERLRSSQEKPGEGEAGKLPWRFGLVLAFTALLYLAPLWLPVYLLVNRNKPTRPARGKGADFWQLLATLRNRNLLGICLGFFCFDYFWYLLLTWLPDYLFEARHLSIIRMGIYASLPYAVFGLSQPFGGWLADRLVQRGWNETHCRKGMVTLGFLFGLLLIPAAHVETAEAAIALIIGCSLVGLATANLQVILQSCAPAEDVAVWTGFENFAGNIGGVLAPVATGFMIARTGSFASAFALGAVLLVTGLLSYWFIVGELKPPRTQPG